MLGGPEQMQGEDGIYPINLHLPGILRLLSEHLYTDPRVVLRELIQNAYDSCQRRLIEGAAGADYSPRIEIALDPIRRLMTIRDNGSGLTEQEIHTYLATIGRGYTAELRERLELGGREEALTLIGQFGLGLLSAFVVADRVVLMTRSYQPGQGSWRWESTGGGTYSLRAIEQVEVGSTFILSLKLAGEFLLNEGIVRQAIRTYADFLPVPIMLNGGSVPVNALDAPWHRGGDLAGYKEYIAGRFEVQEPLAIIPLHDHVERVAQPGGGEDAVVTPLAGVLFIPPRSVVSLKEYGDVAVYVRRMLVSEKESELLPPWAKFVRGVVESSALRPTASREQVRHDEMFYTVQRIIEEQLLEHLLELAKRDPMAWRGIVVAHSDLIKGWALQNHVFFDAVCDLVVFETSRGLMSLGEYLEVSGGAIYYFVEERGSAQEKMLYEARGLVVIDASRFAEEEFLQAYARRHPGIELLQLEPGAAFVFSPDDEARWEAVLRYYSEQGIPARAVRFEPESIPALLIYPPGSDEVARARAALGDLSGPVARLIGEYVRRHVQVETRGVLHVNTASPLMQSLLKLAPGDGAFTAALEIVYHSARFFAGRALTAQEARQSFDMVSYSLAELVRAVEAGKGE